MANTALENEQIVGFIEHFSLLTDPRQQVKVEYPLDEILLLVLCAVLAGANCWVEIAKFGPRFRSEVHHRQALFEMRAQARMKKGPGGENFDRRSLR